MIELIWFRWNLWIAYKTCILNVVIEMGISRMDNAVLKSKGLHSPQWRRQRRRRSNDKKYAYLITVSGVWVCALSTLAIESNSQKIQNKYHWIDCNIKSNLHITLRLSCHLSQFSPITVCNNQTAFCNDFLINVYTPAKWFVFAWIAMVERRTVCFEKSTEPKV